MYRYTVEPLYVKSGQDVIAADFYHPETSKAPPVILMAHGLAGLRQLLALHAQKFAQAGYAVVLFDYRYWGGSTGRPRELISISQQLQDWRTMIHHVSQRHSVDGKKLILWGTGLSAGHILHLAHEFDVVRAALLQVPFLDGTEYAKLYPLPLLTKGLKLSSQDYMAAKVARQPIRLPVVDAEGLSLIPCPVAQQDWHQLLPDDLYWSGQVPARIFFKLLRYRPILELAKIDIPLLWLGAKYDSLSSAEIARQATKLNAHIEYHEWEMQHFDLFKAPYLQQALTTQLAFLHRYFGVD